MYRIRKVKQRYANWRNQDNSPDMRKIILVFALINLIAIAISFIVSPIDNPIEQFDERGLMTAMSALYLAFTSGFALVIYLLKPNSVGILRYFWLYLFVGFLYLFLDEILQFHEILDEQYLRLLLGAPIFFRSWNDVILIGYGIAATVALLAFFSEIIAYPTLVELIVIGFLFFWTHTLIDITQARSTISIILEESAKLFSTSFFALSMISAIKSTVVNSKPR